MKFLTKKDKKIQELENKIALLEAINGPHIYTVEREGITLVAVANIREHMPVEYTKKRIINLLAEKLEPFVEFDLYDNEENPFNEKMMKGVIRIMARK